MKYAKLTEAKVPQTLWFHGSQYDDVDELKINPPSPEKIFFVAKNLDYAKYYGMKNKNKRKEYSSIYICSVKERGRGLETYNRFSESGKKTNAEFGQTCVYFSTYKSISSMRNSQDIFDAMIQFCAGYCKPIIECGYDAKKLRNKYVFSENQMSTNTLNNLIEEIPDFLKKVGLTEQNVLNDDRRWENGNVIREAFCKFWKKIGLNAFDTFETQPTGMSDCLGIFDVSALDSIYAISIPYDVIKKSKELNSDKAIKEFLKNYTIKNS